MGFDKHDALINKRVRSTWEVSGGHRGGCIDGNDTGGDRCRGGEWVRRRNRPQKLVHRRKGEPWRFLRNSVGGVKRRPASDGGRGEGGGEVSAGGADE